MKNKLFIVIAVVLFSLTGLAQNDIFKKYNNNSSEAYEYVSINPQMIQMVAQMGISEDDPESEAFMSMIKSISSFKTIVTSDKLIIADISKWIASRSNDLEELMTRKEEGSNVKFYAKAGKDETHVKELLIFVNGADKLLKAQGVDNHSKKMETVIVSIIGDIDLNQISKLTEKMDIPGGDQLGK